MQKKKIYQLAAAIVLVVAVAAALILTGMRKSTPVSEAQASSVPSSALPGGEAEGPSSAAASSESAVSSEVTEESPVSSFLEQLEEELGISSSETASSSEVSSAASASKADSVSSAVSGSSAAHSVPASSAASGSHAASQAPGSSHASSSSAASENEVDARIDSYIRQLQNLKKQTESKLYGVIYEAYNEYISHPVEERNLGMKVSIVVSKTAKLTSVQGECDKEFNAILKELRQYLRDNGRDQSVADQAEQEYKKMKSDLTSELTGIVYDSAVGSGDGGKWIQEHIEHKR
jgi:hypothetical protein